MWTKPYGKTGKDVSAIGFGGMRFPEPDNVEKMADLALYAHSKGINYFDTAPGYCNDKSEEIMGRAFAQMPADSFYASTKCGNPDGNELRKSLERSLTRLGLSKIHFFHIWCVRTMVDWEARKARGAIAAAFRAREEGLIEHLAVSSHLPGDELGQVLEEGPFNGVTLGYNAINFPFRQLAIDLAGLWQLGVVTMNPLGGGLIPQFAQRFDFIRSENDASVVDAALRFNISQPNISCALVGFSTTEQIDQACRAVEGFEPYTEDHLGQLRQRILDSFDDLCTGCQYCMPCPAEIEIPKYMDAYNYRILLGDNPAPVLGRLKWHWALKPEDAKACINCGACEERCTQHLPIRKRLQELAELAEQPKEQQE